MDLHFLRDVSRRPGPYATVYLDASHDTADAARAVELRWSGQRSTLAEQGADAATMEALDAAVTGGEPAVGRAGRVLVARAGEVVLDRTGPEPPAQPSAGWGQLPDLLPMLLDQPEPVSAVVVRVGETGGEIFVPSPFDTTAAPVPVEDVHGSEYLVHKVRAGGWSHLHMQERVEESWRRNAAEVAARVDKHVSQAGARLLVLAGDPRSRSRLRDELGERAAGIAVEVEHSGGAGADDLAGAVETAMRDTVTADRIAMLERYEQAAGRPDGLAVDGIDAVLFALRAEAVDTLLVDGGVQRDARVWISDGPTQLAIDEDELRGTGAEPIGRAPVDAALLRAAAGSGAAFYPVGGGRTGLAGRPMADGVAALLRYSLPGGA